MKLRLGQALKVREIPADEQRPEIPMTRLSRPPDRSILISPETNFLSFSHQYRGPTILPDVGSKFLERIPKHLQIRDLLFQNAPHSSISLVCMNQTLQMAHVFTAAPGPADHPNLGHRDHVPKLYREAYRRHRKRRYTDQLFCASQAPTRSAIRAVSTIFSPFHAFVEPYHIQKMDPLSPRHKCPHLGQPVAQLKTLRSSLEENSPVMRFSVLMRIFLTNPLHRDGSPWAFSPPTILHTSATEHETGIPRASRPENRTLRVLYVQAPVERPKPPRLFRDAPDAMIAVFQSTKPIAVLMGIGYSRLLPDRR